MTTQLPKERLEEIAALEIKTTSFGTQYADKAHSQVYGYEIVLMARALLAAYEQEPVFFVEIDGDDWINAGRIEGGNRPDLGLLPDGINNLYANPAPSIPAAVPDEMLCDFYEVDSWQGLVRELVGHVEQLQDSMRRNVKPWEDTLPETLLPAYIDRIKKADDACRARVLQSEPQNAPQNIPVNIPAGYALVPIEPTESMTINGFESEPNEDFSEPDVWEAYEAMSGCEQAAHRAKLCWAAMIAAAPKGV